eukprot:CAMPEP_0170059442 /NCGR_PEP_ID=MMETSP0019_2-20121128/1716_1 /TAXON_ID=98059 /ORGANISM="Dinobryon sp., Strain UTEXLB2267" /LENGTH=737 /DNA_ID=CAMNT_0010264689 /DNA_START=629 /DNA_END=2842 /DNA_ORIENTATION=+
MATISCKSVLEEYMEKSPVILPCLLHLTLFTHCFSSCIRCLEHFFSFNFGVAGLILSSITFALTIVSLIYWSFITRERQTRRNCFIPTDEEYYNWIFMLALIASSSWAIAAGFFWPTNNWREISDNLLVAYTYIQLGFIVIVTVLPGRIVRIKVILTSEMLLLKQIFVRYVSHEIRSPLNVVHAGLELVLMDLRRFDKELDDRFHDTVDLLEDIFAASDSAITILNDLLNYEHLDSGNFKLDMSYKPLLRAFEGKLKCAELMAKQKGMDFSVEDETTATEGGILKGVLRRAGTVNDIDLEMNASDVVLAKIVPIALTFLSDAVIFGSYLLIDSGKIDQVLQNLLTNAFKFTPAMNSVKVVISCRPLLAGVAILPTVPLMVGYLRVEVTDTGAGIAMENQENVFGEFAQFNRNKLQGGGGSGLGLWISRRIIDLHQGKMGFSSAGVGCGCSFYFELPLFSQPPLLSPALPPSSLELLSGIEIEHKGDTHASSILLPLQHDLRLITVVEHKEDTHASSTSLPFQHDLRLLAALTTDGAIKVDKNGIMPLFSAEKHGSQIKVRAGSNSINFDHVFQKMLLPPVQYLSHKTRTFPEEKFDDIGVNKVAVKVHILVVDDSHLNRKIVRRILQSATDIFPELTIIEADDGITAIEEVKKHRDMGIEFDFILIDFIMITMNGPVASKILRESLGFKGVMIGITGNALPADIETFLTSGANEVLIKPLTRKKLLDPIQLHLLRKL